MSFPHAVSGNPVLGSLWEPIFSAAVRAHPALSCDAEYSKRGRRLDSR